MVEKITPAEAIRLLDAGKAQAEMKARGVLINASPVVRLVMHLDVSREQLSEVVKHWQAFLQR